MQKHAFIGADAVCFSGVYFGGNFQKYRRRTAGHIQVTFQFLQLFGSVTCGQMNGKFFGNAGN